MRKCPAPGCEVRIPESRFACGPHWYALSPAVRDAINSAFRLYKWAKKHGSLKAVAEKGERLRVAQAEGLKELTNA